MDLDELRAFLAVAKSGSLSEASNEVRVLRSTLAHRIYSLEKRLDIRLVRITDHGVSLTRPGLRLAENGSRVLAAAESAEAMVLETDDSR